MLTYTIAKPYLENQHMTAYEFWPLECDPTPEEIKQQEDERLVKEMDNAQAQRLKILSDFKKRNGRI